MPTSTVDQAVAPVTLRDEIDAAGKKLNAVVPPSCATQDAVGLVGEIDTTASHINTISSTYLEPLKVFNTVVGTIANVLHSLVPLLDYLAMTALTGLGIPTFSPAVSPSKSSLPLLPPPPLISDDPSDDFTRRLQSFAYTGPGSSPSCPQQPIAQTSEAPSPLLGKRKPVPSLRAQRDNKIGDLSKENNEPVPARGKKGKGKRPVLGGDESHPGKKAK